MNGAALFAAVLTRAGFRAVMERFPALREALSSIFDTSLALADVRLNQIMKKLSAWAAILAVPTLVTSFVGMNVGFPLMGSGTGFWGYFLLMIAASVVLYF